MMKNLQKNLDFLLEKYSVDTKAVLKNEKTVVIDGKELPVLAHRSERRFIELKGIVNNGTLVGVSVMRVARIIEKGSDIYAALYRELDICQFILERKIKAITVMENGNVLNAIATAEDDIVCTIEISATLKKGETPKDKHEIISQRGIACDLVVDTQLKPDSLYIFGKENQSFTDADFELYGLNLDEIAIVREAFSMAQKNNVDEIAEINNNLCELVKLAKKSAASGEREVL